VTWRFVVPLRVAPVRALIGGRQFGQAPLSLPFLRPLRSKVVADAQNGDKANKEGDEANSLQHFELTITRERSELAGAVNESNVAPTILPWRTGGVKKRDLETYQYDLNQSSPS
jgi:hypothetical protein